MRARILGRVRRQGVVTLDGLRADVANNFRVSRLPPPFELRHFVHDIRADEEHGAAVVVNYLRTGFVEVRVAFRSRPLIPVIALRRRLLGRPCAHAASSSSTNLKTL